MSILICKGCGGTTNSATCNYLDNEDMLPSKCYVKWDEEAKPVKGCGYDELKEHVLTSKDPWGMFELKFCSDLLKRG
ncbi:MAG: hypothetical protein CSYNP_04182 [Syntrophus sp. SKADARSKE-3]|nr:hypothetical protein [Syntrophus sp. SKADARSKE-3]